MQHKTDTPPLLVPKWAVALTCGIDTQKFGFWFVVRAWAEDLTSHLVQYGFLANKSDLEVLIWHTAYRIQDLQNTIDIWRAAIDTGSGMVNPTEADDWSRTEEIYEWIRAIIKNTESSLAAGQDLRDKRLFTSHAKRRSADTPVGS